jgi:hypothetical protein
MKLEEFTALMKVGAGPEPAIPFNHNPPVSHRSSDTSAYLLEMFLRAPPPTHSNQQWMPF